MAEHGIVTLRQAQIRTGVAHTTIQDILRGRQPGSETVIRLASGFGEDVAVALRLAGHEDIAEVWETGAAPLPERESRGALETTYDPANDVWHEAQDTLPSEEIEEIKQIMQIKIDKHRKKQKGVRRADED